MDADNQRSLFSTVYCHQSLFKSVPHSTWYSGGRQRSAAPHCLAEIELMQNTIKRQYQQMSCGARLARVSWIPDISHIKRDRLPWARGTSRPQTKTNSKILLATWTSSLWKQLLLPSQKGVSAVWMAFDYIKLNVVVAFIGVEKYRLSCFVAEVLWEKKSRRLRMRSRVDLSGDGIV